MVKVNKANANIYFERAIDCYNSIKALQILYYDKDIKPEYLKEYKLKHFDILFMLYSIAIISLVNSLTIKIFGEKSKDHKDLVLYKKLKSIIPEISKFDKIVFEINNIKNSSEYGDKHISKKEIIDIKKLENLIELTKNSI